MRLSNGFFAVLLCLTQPLKADFKDYAVQRQKQQMGTTKLTSPSIVPGFQTAQPAEKRFNDPQQLDSATQSVFGQNPTAQHLKNRAETRPYFILDLQKDPLIKNSLESVRDPEKVLRSDLFNQGLKNEYTYHTCREAKPPIEFRCSKTLVPPTLHIEPAIFQPAKYHYYYCKHGNHPPDTSKCKSKRYYSSPHMYQAEVNIPEKVQESPEAWSSDCGTMGSATENRSCKLIQEVCPKGPETRDVVVTIGSGRQQSIRQITKPCWRYEYLYHCAYPSLNSCASLRERSCEQIDSKCLENRGEVCIQWEQTYKCLSRVNNDKDKVSSGNILLPQGEKLSAHIPNKDMGDAISKLSVLKEVQDEIRASTQDINSLQIFKGDVGKCTIAFGNFKNCCVKQDGWGVSLNLAGCNGEDKALAQKQKRKVCVKIGTYCAQKALGICIRKKKSFCCFPSKLSRIIHEQGRNQLNIGWGKPKRPECRGFTVEELSRINFDQLDLHELFDEILAKTKNITQSTIGTINRNFSNRVGQMSTDIKPQGLNPQTQNKPLQGDF